MINRKPVIVLAVILAVLCVATAVTMAVRTSITPDYSETKPVLAIDADSITSIDVTNSHGRFVLEKKDGQWIYQAKPSVSVNEIVPLTISDAVCNLIPYSTITRHEDLSGYGLDQPAATVVIGADKTYTITVGNMTNTSTDRYVSVGDNNLYIIEAIFYNKVNFTESDLYKKETIPSFTSVSDISASIGPQSVSFTDRETKQSVISAIESLPLSNCVKTDADSAVLEKYGLAPICFSVSVSYTDNDGKEQVFVLDMSTRPDSDGIYYIRINDSGMIYAIDGNSAGLLLTLFYEQLPKK